MCIEFAVYVTYLRKFNNYSVSLETLNTQSKLGLLQRIGLFLHLIKVVFPWHFPFRVANMWKSPTALVKLHWPCAATSFSSVGVKCGMNPGRIITARIAYLTSVLDVLLWTSTSSTSPSFPRSRALTLQFAVNKPLVWLCARECADFCFSQPKRKEGKCFLTPCTLISEFIFSILFSLHLLSDEK